MNFVRIETKECFKQVYPILKEAFPVTELREYHRQEALLQERCYRLYQVYDETNMMIGVIAAWILAEDYIYIEHFAIVPECRNSGLGGRVLNEFVYNAHKEQKQVVLEVELPEDDLTMRRIGFYERHGFTFHTYPYMQPPMRKHQCWLPLRLMTNPAQLDADTYERYKTDIYTNVYQYTESVKINK